MNKDIFYQRLNELAEIWYIDTAQKLLKLPEFNEVKVKRNLKIDSLSNERLLEIIESEPSNPTGYPIVERWKHEFKPEIIRLKQK